jgi:hypothetical protein
MERFKQTIAKLETDIAELKQFKTKIQGSTQSKGDIHYCTGMQEFGEYELDEIDTFRFSVVIGYQYNQYNPQNKDNKTYRYRLLNPTPELTAYLRVQGKTFTTDSEQPPYQTTPVSVDPENYEEYCMEKGGTPFVLTDEIRKCLDCKLWEFVKQHGSDADVSKDFREEFYIDIPIQFKNTYKITPHVSFYITPLSNALDECLIHEITTKQVVFRIKYGNIKNLVGKNPQYKTDIYSGLKLHYSISGVVEENQNLLD